MRPPRGGGPNHVGPVIPATTNQPFPQCALDALAQVSKHVRLAGPARKRTLAPQYAEWQPLIDNDIFCLTSDRTTTRLSSIQQFALLRVLSQFFTEKSEDSSKNAYFEAIFLGRQGETVLHEYRIQVLFRLASFALQVPVLHLYMPISQWLSKETTSRNYAEVFIKMLVEHFIYPAYDKQLYQFLLPLDLKCPEFTVFFITYAPKFSEMTSPMVVVCGDYFVKNNNYILNQFRDSAPLAKEFVRSAFPKYLSYIVNERNFIPASINLNMGVSELLRKWHTKIREVQLDTSYLWNTNAPWTKTRSDYLLAEVGRNQSRREIVAENLLPVMSQMPSNFEKAKELKEAVNKIELIRKQKLTRSKNQVKEKATNEMMDIDLVDDTGDLSAKKHSYDDRSNGAKRPGMKTKKPIEPFKKAPSLNKIAKHSKPEPYKKNVVPDKVLPSPASPDAEIPPAASPQAEIPPPASPEEEYPPPASPPNELPPPASPEDEIPPPASPQAEIAQAASPQAEIPLTASPHNELPPPASPDAEIPPPASPPSEQPPPASPEDEVPPPASPCASPPASPCASPRPELPPPTSPEPDVPPPASPEPDIPPPSSPVHMEPSPLKQKVIPM